MQLEYGTTIDTTSAELLQESSLPRLQQTESRRSYSQDGNMLWEYGELGSIGGIRVRDCDRGLPIDSSDLLENAFELHMEPKLMVTWLSPDDRDGIARYEELLKQAGEHRVLISSEDRQYDQSRSAFMVLVRYDELEYRLHNRFNYLHDEQQL